MKRLVAVLGAACMVVSLAAVAGNNGAQAVPSVPTPANVSWSACNDGSGLECGSLQVPLDYNNPGGEKITLALSRRKATALPYRGIMVTNPGGPGASGLHLPLLADYVPGNAATHYDWIGFDPRGVGASTPSLHCNRTFFGANRPNFTPKTRALMRYWVRKTMRYSLQCVNSPARRLLPFLTTRDNVKDVESIRAALRADAPGPEKTALDKLNYYGFSYGTYIGQTYAVTYPSKVGRFVLDGVVDPVSYWYRANLNQEIGFDRNLNIYFQWIAKHSSVFKLGTDWRAIRRGFQAELRKLDRHPAAAGRLGPDELIDAMLSAGYYVYGWNDIGLAYSNLIRHGRGGALFSMYADGNMGDDNGYAMYLATQCTDVRRPSWTRQVRDAWRINKSHPFLAWDNTWFNAPCRNWQAPSHSRIALYGSSVTAKILMINETYDAATPFSGALTSRGRFPSASLIEGRNGTTHAGSLSGVACVDNRIANYLSTGAVPTRLSGRRSDVVCPKVPPPPAGSSSRYAGRGGMPSALRDQLLFGQRYALR
jgi:pimeloyl-ACP methyl ester carboxylesterase